MRSLFTIYVVIYFLAPTLIIYLAIFTQIRIPLYIELIPLLLIIVNKTFPLRLKPQDLLFAILMAGCVSFVARNVDDFSWISNYEVRGMFLIAINYFIFRALVKKQWSDSIRATILKLFELSMYLMICEFVIINVSDISGTLEDGYLRAYPERERLHESIVTLTKPFGLYPGTHNSGIVATISILYLSASKSISQNRAFFALSALVFLICFSLTGFLTLITIYTLVFLCRSPASRYSYVARPLYLLSFGLICFLALTYYLEITQLRSGGELVLGDSVAFSDSAYILSIGNSVLSLINDPFGVAYKKVDFYINEVYVSRVLQYFGILSLLFLILSAAFVILNLRHQNRTGLFFGISYLALVISSFHYPSYISYPLNILVPLTFIYVTGRRRKTCLEQTGGQGESGNLRDVLR